jgi:hypothetical protein
VVALRIRQSSLNFNHTFADPQLLLIERAVKAGIGQWDFAYLYEVLKQGAE